MRHITLGVKRAGEPCAGNPHARFDWAGGGDGPTAMAKRARSWKRPIHAKPAPTGYRASSRPYLSFDVKVQDLTPSGRRLLPLVLVLLAVACSREPRAAASGTAIARA